MCVYQNEDFEKIVASASFPMAFTLELGSFVCNNCCDNLGFEEITAFFSDRIAVQRILNN